MSDSQNLIELIKERYQDVGNLFERRDFEGCWATYVSPHGYRKARRNSSLYSTFDILYFDGLWMAMLMRMLRVLPSAKRQSPDMTSLAPLVFEYARNANKKLYLIGGTSEEVTVTANRIRQRYPGIQIVGFRSGYFAQTEEESVIRCILSSQPDLLMIGMGSGRQEKLAQEVGKAGYEGSILTCGGFIHQTASKLDYYPSWIDSLELRWLYRGVRSPRILWRVITDYPLATMLVVWDWVKWQKNGTG